MKKKKPTCVRIIIIYFKTLKQVFFLPYRKFKRFKKNFKKVNFSSEGGCITEALSGCFGCGCIILILWCALSMVSWAWHIHWLFGVLMFLLVANFIFN